MREMSRRVVICIFCFFYLASSQSTENAWKCPSGSVYCYQLLPPGTWDGSFERCIKKGGGLPALDHQAYLEAWLHDYNISYAWLSLKLVNYRFQWMDITPSYWTYNKRQFAKGHPQPQYGCVRANHTVLFETTSCQENNYAICTIKKSNIEQTERALEFPEVNFQVMLGLRSKSKDMLQIAEHVRVKKDEFDTLSLHCEITTNDLSPDRRPRLISWLKDGVYLQQNAQVIEVKSVYDRTKRSYLVRAHLSYANQGTYACEVTQLGNTNRTRSNSVLITLAEVINQILVVRHRSQALTLEKFMGDIIQFYKQVFQQEIRNQFEATRAMEKLDWDCLIERETLRNNSLSVQWNISVYINVGEDAAAYAAATAWFSNWNGTASFLQWLKNQTNALDKYRRSALSLVFLYAEWCLPTVTENGPVKLLWGASNGGVVSSEPLCLNGRNQPVPRFCYPSYLFGATWSPFSLEECKTYKPTNAFFCPVGYQEAPGGCSRFTEPQAWEVAMSECFQYYPDGNADKFGFNDWLGHASTITLRDSTHSLLWLPARRYTRYGHLYISFLWKKPTQFPEDWTQLKFVDNQQHNQTAAMCLAFDRQYNYLRMIDCAMPLPALCLTKKFIMTSVSSPMQPFQCPLDWYSNRVVPMQNICFRRFESAEALTWDQARNACIALDASLIQISDSMTQIVASKIYGFEDSSIKVPAWIGLKRVNENGTYCWHYGNTEPNTTECLSTSYQNWAPSPKENDFMNGYGVSMDIYGHWKPLPHTMTLKHYICQMEVRSSVKQSLHVRQRSLNVYDVKLRENVPNFRQTKPLSANMTFKDLLAMRSVRPDSTSIASKSSFIIVSNKVLPFCFVDGTFHEYNVQTDSLNLHNKTGLLTCYTWLDSPRVLIRSNTHYAKQPSQHVYIARSVRQNDKYNSTLHDATWQQNLYGTQYGQILSTDIMSRTRSQATPLMGKEINISIKILGFFPYDDNSLGIDYRIEGRIVHRNTSHPVDYLKEDIQFLQLLRDALFKKPETSKNVKNNSKLEYIYVRSIEYCPEVVTEMTPGREAEDEMWDRPETLNWALTPVGMTIYPKELCVESDGHIVLRKCDGDLQTGAYWGPLQVGEKLLEEPIGQEICSKPNETTVRLWNLVQHTIKFNLTVRDTDPLDDLLNITYNWSPQTVDVKLSSLALTTALKSHPVLGTTQFNQSVAILDNVIQVNAEQLATTQRLLNASNNFITALEDIQNRAVVAEGERSLRATSQSILVEAYDAPQDLVGYEANLKTKDDNVQFTDIETRPLFKSEIQNSTQDGLLSDAYVAVLLPEAVLDQSDSSKESQRVSFTVLTDGRFMDASSLTLDNDTLSVYQFNYNHPQQYEASAGYMYNSPVAQVNVRGISEDTLLSVPISAAFRPTLRNKKPICVSWQKHLNGNRGGWSPDKCRYIGRRKGVDVCQCSHLSFYAELFNIYDEDLTLEDDVHAVTLNLITIIGTSLSILGLVGVVLTFLLFKEWRKSTGNKVLFNLSLALIGFLTVFLAGFDLTSDRQLCKYVAIALHYFLLASFAWMLVEAIHQYYRLVKYMGTYIARFMWKTTPFAWGLPILPVMAVLLYDQEDRIYRDNPRCWISKDAFYPAVLGPISAVLAVNISIFVLIIRSVVCCRAKLQTNQPHSRLVLQQFNMSVCVFFLLGLSWVFGFMTINDAGILFTYLFCIFNSLQGFFIFVFFVFRERSARQLWIDLWYGRDSRKNGQNQIIALSSGNRSQSRVPENHTRFTRM